MKLTGTSIKSVKTSNSKVATISKKGKVTAKKAGAAMITLTGKDGKKYTCKITVKKHSHTWNSGKITTKPTYLKEGVKTYTCKTCGKTKTESIVKKEATTEEDYIQKFYEQYGGSWDCEGEYIGAGGYRGRSKYTNDVYNTSFQISKETRVSSDRAICDFNDSKIDDGIIGECIDDGSIWLANAGKIDLYLYTNNNTSWSVDSEENFIKSYEVWYRKGWSNSYDEITFSEIYKLKIGENTYICADLECMWSTNAGDCYKHETMLVRACDDGVLVYWIAKGTGGIGTNPGAVTEKEIREIILY